MLPQTNATLISIERPAGTGQFTEDYDRPATDASTESIWQGNADAYVHTEIIGQFNEGGTEENRILRVTLMVEADELGAIKLQSGDTLVYLAGDPDNPDQLTGRIQTFTDPAYLPTMLDYYKCALEEVNAP